MAEKKRKRLGMAQLCLLAVAGALLVGSVVIAADHADSPLASTNKKLDIDDVYVFRSTENSNNLVVAVTTNSFSGEFSTNSLFENKGKYEIYFDKNSDLTADTTAKITFTGGDSEDQIFTVEGLTTDPIQAKVTPKEINSTPIIAEKDGIKAFCGERDDPFFFDLTAFRSFVAAPYVPAKGLRASGAGDPANFFKGLNVNAIVLEIPLTKLGVSANSGTLKVWAKAFKVS